MLIDETAFDTMIGTLGTTATAIIDGMLGLAFVVALVVALARWGIRGSIKAFDMMDSKYDDEV